MEAMVDASRVQDSQQWSGGARLSTIQKRVVRLAEVEARLPELVERVRVRTERVVAHVLAGLRAIEARDDAAACRHLVDAGDVEEADGRRAEAERYYEKALELGRRPRDRRGEALALRRLGRVARAGGRLDRALDLYGRSREIAAAASDAQGVVIGCLGIGHVLADQGRWADARGQYLEGMEALGDDDVTGLLHLCNALSVVERRLGDLAASAEWIDRGEAELPMAADAEATAHLHHGRGKLHLAAGDPDAAAAAFRQALALPVSHTTRAVALLNLAEAGREAGALEEAESTAREAEQVAIAHADLVNLPHVYVELGELASRRGDRDGFVFFEQALNLLRDIGDPPLAVAATQRAYGAFEARFGDRDSALARLAIAKRIYRSVGSVADADAVSRLIDSTGGSSNSSETDDVEE